MPGFSSFLWRIYIATAQNMLYNTVGDNYEENSSNKRFVGLRQMLTHCRNTDYLGTRCSVLSADNGHFFKPNGV